MRWASAALVALCLLAGGAAAQTDWPSRPVRIIVPSPPSGGTDIIGRVLAQHFSRRSARSSSSRTSPAPAT
jgi:tripartite-type tricarboxylate transporter receptor subunit TctC